jgi:transposase
MSELVLNRAQRFRLRQQLKHAQDASLYRRTQAMLELDRGRTVADVARSLGVTRQTIYNWLEAYQDDYDPLALVDAARSGRPANWSPDLQDLLATLLQESPMQWDYQAVNWTVPLLRQQLATWDGRWLSEDTLRRRLHELGYVWKRTRYVLPPDPEQEKKKAHSPEAEKPASPECHALRG